MISYYASDIFTCLSFYIQTSLKSNRLIDHINYDILFVKILQQYKISLG